MKPQLKQLIIFNRSVCHFDTFEIKPKNDILLKTSHPTQYPFDMINYKLNKLALVETILLLRNFTFYSVRKLEFTLID